MWAMYASISHDPAIGYTRWEMIRYQKAKDVKRKPSDGKGG